MVSRRRKSFPRRASKRASSRPVSSKKQRFSSKKSRGIRRVSRRRQLRNTRYRAPSKKGTHAEIGIQISHGRRGDSYITALKPVDAVATLTDVKLANTLKNMSPEDVLEAQPFLHTIYHKKDYQPGYTFVDQLKDGDVVILSDKQPYKLTIKECIIAHVTVIGENTATYREKIFSEIRNHFSSLFFETPQGLGVVVAPPVSADKINEIDQTLKDIVLQVLGEQRDDFEQDDGVDRGSATKYTVLTTDNFTSWLDSPDDKDRIKKHTKTLEYEVVRNEDDQWVFLYGSDGKIKGIHGDIFAARKQIRNDHPHASISAVYDRDGDDANIVGFRARETVAPGAPKPHPIQRSRAQVDDELREVVKSLVLG